MLRHRHKRTPKLCGVESFSGVTEACLAIPPTKELLGDGKEFIPEFAGATFRNRDGGRKDKRTGRVEGERKLGIQGANRKTLEKGNSRATRHGGEGTKENV